MQHAGGVLAQLDDIFHGLVVVDIDSLFYVAEEIMSEMATNV